MYISEIFYCIRININITGKVGKMIAIDYYPLQVAEDIGFTGVLKALEPRYGTNVMQFALERVSQAGTRTREWSIFLMHQHLARVPRVK